MRVTATADAAQFIRTRGGQLFVWPAEHRSARLTLAFLQASVDPPPRALDFRRVEAGDFLLFMHPRAQDPPRRTACRASRPPSSAHRGVLGRARLHRPLSGVGEVGQRGEAESSATGSCFPAGACTSPPAPKAPAPEARRTDSRRATLPQPNSEVCPFPTNIGLSYLTNLAQVIAARRHWGRSARRGAGRLQPRGRCRGLYIEGLPS